MPLPPRHSSGVPARPPGPVGTVEPRAGPSLFVRPWRGSPRRPAPAAQPSAPASPQQTRPLGDPRPPPASPPPSVTDAAAAAPRTAGPVTPPLPRPPRPHGCRPHRRSVGGAPGLRSGSARGPALRGRARIQPAAERPDSRPGATATAPARLVVSPLPPCPRVPSHSGRGDTAGGARARPAVPPVFVVPRRPRRRRRALRLAPGDWLAGITWARSAGPAAGGRPGGDPKAGW